MRASRKTRASDKPRNIQAARSQGVEVVLVLRPVKGWTASGTYTFLHTEVTDDGVKRAPGSTRRRDVLFGSTEEQPCSDNGGDSHRAES